MIGIESVGHDQGVEGAGARGEAGGNHVVNHLGDGERVAVSRSLHELFHEDEAEALLRRRSRRQSKCRRRRRRIVAPRELMLRLSPSGFFPLLRRGDCGGANDEERLWKERGKEGRGFGEERGVG